MTRRTQRLGETFREVIGELLQRHVKDPRIGFVTVTAVRVTPDLSKAHVYYTVLGDSEQREATEAGLDSAAPFLRTEAARRVRIKTTPELVFHFDDAVDHGRRVDELLREASPSSPVLGHGDTAEEAELDEEVLVLHPDDDIDDDLDDEDDDL